MILTLFFVVPSEAPTMNIYGGTVTLGSVRVLNQNGKKFHFVFIPFNLK